MRVRGLKFIADIIFLWLNLSHPMRVRGLKYELATEAYGH